MNIFNAIRADLMTVIDGLQGAGALPSGLDLSRVTMEPPREAAHGDMATNAAMMLAKPAGMAPRAIAEALLPGLLALERVEAVEIGGPGFINLRLRDGVWRGLLADILASGRAYGASSMGGGVPVNVEYVSANPTGPLHIGHARGAVVGDVLARLLAKAGFAVTKEYYVNDSGAQVETLARSALLRYREALGEEIGDIPEGLYPGDYLKDVGQALADAHGAALKTMDEAEALEIARSTAVAMMLALIKADLKLLGVEQDVFSSERGIVASGAVDRALARLTEAGHIYVGVLEPPKGKAPEDWEPRPQTLFRSTAFGDDVDRALKKSDGSWTYFAPDIAYHFDKFERGFARQIDIFGADHGGYVKRMKAAVAAMTDGRGDLDIKLCQLVRLMDQGEPLKMSKRAGTFVTLRDLIEAVGRDVVRFFLLTRKSDAPIDFDLTAVKEQSRDNPVFYVHYAHARCASVLRAAGPDIGPETLAHAALDRLTDPDEIAMIRVLAQWPRVVETAAEAAEPHRLAFYLQEVAASFHGLWSRGKDDTTMRFLVDDDPDLTRARLALVLGVKTVIASGLDVFGVEPLEELS